MSNIEKLAIEREVFEIYQYEQGFINKASFEKDEDGTYFNMRMRDDWRIWIARATAKALQQSSEPVAGKTWLYRFCFKKLYKQAWQVTDDEEIMEIIKRRHESRKDKAITLEVLEYVPAPNTAQLQEPIAYMPIKLNLTPVNEHGQLATRFKSDDVYKVPLYAGSLPPSVPLEKYNKLLDAATYVCYDRGDIEYLRQAIAEAEL